MGFLKRWSNYRQRNQGAVASKFVQDIMVRAWLRPGVRRVVSPMFRPKPPKHWVFMGGCYNSGTTILREIVGAHPDVATLPREGVRMTSAFPNLEAGGWQRMWHRNAESAEMTGRDPAETAKRAAQDWAPWWQKGAKVYLEKSIVHGAWMPFLQQGFDNARFVGVVRNGYCVCEGIRRRARPSGEAQQALNRDTYPIAEVGRQWVFANEKLIVDSPKLQNYHEIRYEAFVRDPLGTVQALFRFLNVDPDAVTQIGENRLKVGNRSFDIVDGNASSLERLGDDDIASLNTVIGPMMTGLGYELSGKAEDGNG